MTEHEAAWPPEDIELALDHDSDIDSDSEEIYDAKGNLITEEYVRDAISDVHRAIDEGRVPVPTGRPGRPSLTGEGTHSPRVSFRVPEELRERAKARAEQEGKSVSALAREAFEQFLRAG
ncbi:ribbon-helix-helix protein, CopG family [Nonomuraea terrae]|uniref:Ribbon-helix-helix protein, CopG family n=1 Tax=Nonomuraea terrae TaxID=2530383 RepID=A0A4R4ZA62_9ACTN|nr:ribbon-helix-helix protein, CopG family [Nonomuraea terrae]TDD54640.1 ribbon-helix-helix protein, CopG family [Nonomuraea terrae]